MFGVPTTLDNIGLPEFTWTNTSVIHRNIGTVMGQTSWKYRLEIVQGLSDHIEYSWPQAHKKICTYTRVCFLFMNQDRASWARNLILGGSKWELSIPKMAPGVSKNVLPGGWLVGPPRHFERFLRPQKYIAQLDPGLETYLFMGKKAPKRFCPKRHLQLDMD